MEAVKRREDILNQLKQSSTAVVARELAECYQVSRQVIVGDIALLRAAGSEIVSTPKGYLLRSNEGVRFKKKIVCHHSREDTKRELDTIVSLGGAVIDVTVEHPIYGEINGVLNIENKEEVDAFTKKLASDEVALLSDLTDGLHTHTIATKDKETADKIEAELRKEGLLYSEE